MKKMLTGVGVIGLLTILLVSFAFANGVPFPVGATQKEPAWQSWGYTVDGQTWGHWFSVTIPWGAPGAMSGNYMLDEDFLLWVDPNTSGLADPSSVYGANWWNHDNVYGLGEFFDAGKQSSDQNYSFTLNLITNTWGVFYDGNRNRINGDAIGEHNILAGSISQYWNQGGYFYGILSDADGKYDGYFTSYQNDGTPDLVRNGFHAGTGAPIPEPGTILLLGAGFLGLGIIGWYRKRRA